MSTQTKKIQRTTTQNNSVDPSSLALQCYNKHTGAQKNMEMGHHLIPIDLGGSFTTNASTLKEVPKGVTLAIYNPTAGALSVRVSGNSAATLLAVGAVDAATGEVGVALQPNSYTYISTYNKGFVITSAGVFTYVVADDTYITDQSQT